MDIVVALVTTEITRRRVARALGEVRVRFCETVDELPVLLATTGSAAIVSQLRDRNGAPTRPVIARLHRRIPGLSVVLLLAGDPLTAGDRYALGRAGVIAEAGEADRDLEASITSALDRAREHSAAADLDRRILPLVPSSLHPFLSACAREAGAPVEVRDAAARAGYSQRTLRTLLADAGLPPPGEIIRWYRLIHAARALDVSGKPIKKVAELLGFGEGRTLRDRYSRLAGRSLSRIPAGERFEATLERFIVVVRRAVGGADEDA